MAAADRDLLFGLLALQNALIDQSALVAAFHAWTREKTRSMAEHLVSRGDLDAEQRALLEALVVQHLKKHGGDTEKSLAAISAGRSTRERLAQIGDSDLGRTLTCVGSGSTQHDDDADRTATYSVGSATSDGQRFRVLRPHARGGLGAVFVALDAELHREVALKQILDDHADDPESRARFLIEAEITGGLEHPGVVPVYGLGSYADGRPYYAMRFIRGDSLKEAADRFHADASLKADPGRRSLELRQLLRRFTDVCNAIDYAHSRGVLHRDIKPGNIIVGKHGETLVVDWGLAKAMGRTDPGLESGERALLPSSASSLAGTLPGSALGTPAYMSPEQAEGDLEHLGTRSDVYSLGATLYYLLTGRPPMTGEIGEVLGAVRRGDFPPPRRHDATIDQALEAVCLKAMALRPADRFDSPRALAEDVERWMADEPVTARREPAAERARRWMRRHRTAMTAAAAAALMAIAGLVVVLAVQGRANRDLQAAYTREQDRFDLAMEAIKTFHTGISEDLLLKQKEFQELRTNLLRGAQAYYGKLERLLHDRTDRRSRAALGEAFAEIGDLTDQIGSKEEALALQRRSLAVREELASAAGADSKSRTALGVSVEVIARLLGETGRYDEAMRARERARDIWEGLAKDNPNVPRFRRLLGRSYGFMGWNLFETGRTSEALEALGRDRVILEALTKAHADDEMAWSDLAQSDHTLGTVLAQTSQQAEALAAYGRAREIRQRLAKTNPNLPRIRTDLAWTLHNMSNVLYRAGRMDEARKALGEALTIRRALADARPNIAEFQSDLARTYYSDGRLLESSGKNEAALEAYGRALATIEPLARANPTAIELQRHLGDWHYATANLLGDVGRKSEAREAYARALRVLEPLARANPDLPELQSVLAGTLNNVANLLFDAGRMDEALTSYKRAAAIEEPLAKANPTILQYQDYLMMHHAGIGRVLSRTGHRNEAVASFRRVTEIAEAVARANPANPGLQSNWGGTVNDLGSRLLEAGRTAEALAAYRRALEIQEPVAKANPTILQYQHYLANHLANIGKALSRMGRPAEAIRSYERSLKIREGLAAAHPDNPKLLSDAAIESMYLGSLKAWEGDPAGGLALCRLAWERLGRIPKPSAANLYTMARARAQIGALIAKVSPASTPGPAEPRSDHLEAAMTLLRRAISEGYRDLSYIRQDGALDPLRSRPDFQSLILDLAFPADPFARGE
jgi:eukaryotic-like serine/threonine-protein kinase